MGYGGQLYKLWLANVRISRWLPVPVAVAARQVKQPEAERTCFGLAEHVGLLDEKI